MVGILFIDGNWNCRLEFCVKSVNVFFRTYLFMFLAIIGLVIFAIKQYETMLGKFISVLLLMGMGVLFFMIFLSQEKFGALIFQGNRIVCFRCFGS
jgi:hypothetical protein